MTTTTAAGVQNTRTPEALKNSKLAAKKAFQRLWVAGAMGAFFSAFIKTLPIDWKNRSSNPDWTFTINTLLRYFYLLWLLAYFFASNLRAQSPEPPRKYEVSFDLIQSISALTAAYCTGFVVPVAFSDANAFGFTNSAMAIIALAAFCLGLKRSQEKTPVNAAEHKTMQNVRVTGLTLSVVSAIVAFWGHLLINQFFVSSILLLLLMCLFMVLAKFIVMRVTTLPALPPIPGTAGAVDQSLPTKTEPKPQEQADSAVV